MKKGFTLMELLVVILIISVVSTSSVIMFGNINEDAKKIERENLYKNIQRSALMYLDLNEDWTNQFVKNGEIYISINELKGLNYVNVDTKDPITKKEIPGNYFVKVYVDDAENPSYVSSCIVQSKNNGFDCVSENDGKKTYNCDYCFAKNKPDENIVTPPDPNKPDGNIVTPPNPNKPLKCTYTPPDGSLDVGDVYENGQYIYTYKKKLLFKDGILNETIDKIPIISSLVIMQEDGWSVKYKSNSVPVGEKISVCSEINGKPVLSMNGMFSETNLNHVDLNFDTSNVIEMDGMFYASDINTLDVRNLDTSKVKSMKYMFDQSKASKITFGGKFNTSNVEDMHKMFEDTKQLHELDLSSFNTSKVKNMRWMFEDSTAETVLIGDKFNTSNVKDMSGMFLDSGIKKFGLNGSKFLDVSHFNTKNVNDMHKMFKNSAATKIVFGNNFDTSNVDDMNEMFKESKTSELNLSIFNTSNVKDMDGMFYNSLTTKIIFGKNFNTSNVKDFHEMFRGSQATELDLSGFNFSKRSYIIPNFGIDNMFKDSAASTVWVNNQFTKNILEEKVLQLYRTGKPNSLNIKIK